MKIAICGSMTFAEGMIDAKAELEKLGHVVYTPEGAEEYSEGVFEDVGGSEGTQRKIHGDLIRKYYDVIKYADAILVLNHKKRDIDHYVGGNAFLEMGFAHILKKPIYLVNPVPDMDFHKQEIEAMQPIVIYEDLSKIK